MSSDWDDESYDEEMSEDSDEGDYAFESSTELLASRRVRCGNRS